MVNVQGQIANKVLDPAFHYTRALGHLDNRRSGSI